MDAVIEKFVKAKGNNWGGLDDFKEKKEWVVFCRLSLSS
jgi:hypothetical protein